MSLRSLEVLAGMGVSRREMVGALVRWTVPTVLTITLAARKANAASCPPCTKMSGGQCKACTMNQILNCNCEPCLGYPYCANGPHAPVARPLGSTSSGNLQGQVPGAVPGQDQLDSYLKLMRRRQSMPGDNPFGLDKNPLLRSPFSTSPFGASRPYGRLPGDTALRSPPRGLYDRLRPPLDDRRPF